MEGATGYKVYDRDNNVVVTQLYNEHSINNVGVGEYWYYITGVNEVGEGPRRMTGTVIKEGLTAVETRIEVAPTASVCMSGNRLSSVVLSGGSVEGNVEGVFEFANDSTIVSVSGEYTVRYIPTDLAAYRASEVNVYVEVKTIEGIVGDLEAGLSSGDAGQVSEAVTALVNQFTDEAKEQLATSAAGETIELNEEQTASLIANAPNVAEGFDASEVTVVVPEDGAVTIPNTSTPENPVYLPFIAGEEYDMTVNGVTKKAMYDGVSTLLVNGEGYQVGEYIPFGSVMFYLGILGSPVGYPVGNRLTMENDTTYLVMTGNVVYLLTYNGGTLPVVWNGVANNSGLYIGNPGDATIDTTGPGSSAGDNLDWPSGIIVLPGFGSNPQNEVPCFPAGTRVLTNVGYKRVEELEGTERIVTPDGRELTFKVYSRKTVGTKETAPYLIKRNAFGAEPKREIRLSPLHAIQSRKNVWQIPRYAALKNGKIEQYGLGEEITYYHIELPNYFRDNIVAEGSVVESFGGKQTKGLTTVYRWSERLEGFTRVSGKTEKKGL